MDQNNNTALHLSCLQGHEECALAILEKCGDNLIHTTNADGKTPLHIAARSGMVRVVQELVRRGGNLSARDCDGETLLFHLTSRLASELASMWEGE